MLTLSSRDGGVVQVCPSQCTLLQDAASSVVQYGQFAPLSVHVSVRGWAVVLHGGGSMREHGTRIQLFATCPARASALWPWQCRPTRP